MTKNVLTIEDANEIARGKAVIVPDDVDPTLWCVMGAGDGPCPTEVHEPMTRQELENLLADWA